MPQGIDDLARIDDAAVVQEPIEPLACGRLRAVDSPGVGWACHDSEIWGKRRSMVRGLGELNAGPSALGQIG
jgi:hypothetical protein